MVTDTCTPSTHPAGPGRASLRAGLDAWGDQLGSTGSTVNPYRYGGAWGYITDPSGMRQLGARFYWPEIGRFVQQDPMGDGMNWYAYVGNNPVTWVDPEGLRKKDAFDYITDFVSGFGDVISFGLTKRVRRWMGTDEMVDPCSEWYRGGEWAGVAHSFATGVAGAIRAAGARGAGREFSHWIPARFGRAWGGRSGRLIERKSVWNGNWVSPMRHAKHDPFRYLKGMRKSDKWPPIIQQLDRVPWAWRGTVGGAAWGTGGWYANNAWN